MPVEKLHRTTPAPANRSPARVHLSECIAAHEAMLSRANAIKQAQRRLLDQKIAASNLVEETKAELEAVRRDERRLVADAAIAGEAFDTPAPIKTAMAAHEEARAALNHVMRAAALLDEEGRVVTDELGIAKFRRDEAVAAVIKSSPAIPKLLEAFDSARARVADYSAALLAIGLTRLPNGDAQRWQTLNRATPVVETASLGEAWRKAIAALASDADAPLPGEG